MLDEFTSDERWVVVRHRVLYGDTDAMGIVYYANYLRFFEMGRNEYLRVRCGSYREMEAYGIRLPVIEVSARYRASARFDDQVGIATRLESVGYARTQFAYRLVRLEDEALLVEGSTMHACVSAATGRAKRFPSDVRARLLRQCT